MTEKMHVSRRSFLEGAALGALAVPSFIPTTALGADGTVAPSDKVLIGLIGCGGMGCSNLDACAQSPDVVVAAVCDVNGQRLNSTQEKYKATANAYTDYRALLAVDDLDGVIIATPPHWHTLQAVHACEAKKDIYLQKPMTLYLAEDIAVKNAVAKHKRVSQIGTQIHATENYRRVVELVRSGNLGKISVVRTFNVMNQGKNGLGKDPNTTPPEGLNWEAWLGPARARPYNRILATGSYEHCSFMEYSGGWTPGMAPHILDLPVWALDLGYPMYIASTGGRFTIDDDGDAPDVQEILWQYPGLTVTWMSSLVNSYGFDLHGEPVPQRRLGIYFHGLNGTMYCNYDMHKIVPEGKAMEGKEPPASRIPPSPGHEREWLDCIKSRKEPSCCVGYHSKVNVPLVLGNLALRVGRALKFDPATAKIVGDEEAAHLAKPEYRSPYRFPEEYL